MSLFSRRNFIKAGTATAVGVSLSQIATAAPKDRVLRIAHISDIHLDTRPVAVENFKRVFTEINTMKDKPDLIINTGDSVFAVDGREYTNAETQWNLLDSMLKKHNKIPMMSCIGNHDELFGPNEATDKQYRDHKFYGKKWVQSILLMPNRYYTSQVNGWSFIALDSINDDDYSLGAEQFSWLEAELNRIPSTSPICIFSHVAILSIIPMMRGLGEKGVNDFRYPASRQHKDALELKRLFYKHPNVKLCLSGHTHQVDEITFLGVKYIVGGAVSGNWWMDDGRTSMVFEEFPPAYTIIDLYKDNSMVYQTVPYSYVSA
jgi:3',5'-cyclic AMP phosphodiesterase CpdA